MTLLNEGLDHLDLKGMIEPSMSIDEYAAKTGNDNDVVTLAFTVFSSLAGEDLVTWFERGYTHVLDASVSDGELEPGKHLVFVELKRRSRIPSQIVTMLSDLETLTGIKLRDWTIEIRSEEYVASEENIRDNLILNPNEYKMDKEKQLEMNEYRELAGLEPLKVCNEKEDSYIKNIKAMAGF